jgi:hypothetical protein
MKTELAGAGDHVRVPHQGKNNPASQKDANPG